jgi:cell division septation protein DedD
MKKRKPPIILVTLAVLLAGGAFVLNYSAQSSQNPETPQPQQQQPQAQTEVQQKPNSPLGAPRKDQSTQDVASNIKSSLGDRPRKMSEGSAMAQKMGYKPGDSTMLVKRHPDEKPKPSDTNPYSNWWGDNK